MHDDALRALPKVELHCHLELTARHDLLKALLKAKGHSVDEAAFRRDFLITEPVEDLPTLLNIFLGHRDLLDSPEVVERMTYECCADMSANGVRLLELRYAPSFLCDAHAGMTPDNMHAAVMRGVQRGRTGVPDGGLGCCAFCSASKRWKRTAIGWTLPSKKRKTSWRLTLRTMNWHTDQKRLSPCLDRAKSEGFAVTIHAGEAEGPQAARNIRNSIELLHADRIGHGVRILEDPDVLEFVRERGTVLELCPTSNWLSQVCPTREAHPFRQIMDAGIRTTVNNRRSGHHEH